MDSEDKLWATFWASGFAAIIAIALIISYTSIQTMPLRELKATQETSLKMACIQQHGIWGATDNDNKPPYSCKPR